MPTQPWQAWTRVPCLGCGAPVRRQRDAWVEVIGTLDGAWVCVLGTHPTDVVADQLPIPDEPMFHLGFAHRACLLLSRQNVRSGNFSIPDTPLQYTIETGTHLIDGTEYRPDEPPREGDCPFCQRNDQPLTDEDVYPSWLIRLLNSKGVITRRGDTVRRGASRVLVPVCRDCNNTWMSVIENDVKDLVVSLSSDVQTLNKSQLELLATWATIKALLFDIAYGDPQIPSGFGHELRLLKRPPTGIYVWVAAYSGRNLAFVHRQTIESDGGVIHGISMTFNMARLLLQVFVPKHRGDLNDDLSAFNGTVVKIWPSAETEPSIEWPPSHYYADDSAEVFSKWLHASDRDSPIVANVSEATLIRFGNERHVWLDTAEFAKLRTTMASRGVGFTLPSDATPN